MPLPKKAVFEDGAIFVLGLFINSGTATELLIIRCTATKNPCLSYEPRREIGLRGFQPGLIQTGMCSQRRGLEVLHVRKQRFRLALCLSGS